MFEWNYHSRYHCLPKRTYSQLVQKRLRFTSTATGLTDSERLLIDSIKRRAPKKKSNVNLELEGLSDKPVVALSTAEGYNLEAIQRAIVQQGLYQQVVYDTNDFDDEIVHLTAKYKLDEEKREFFIFRFVVTLANFFQNLFEYLYLEKVVLCFGTCLQTRYDLHQMWLHNVIYG